MSKIYFPTPEEYKSSRGRKIFAEFLENELKKPQLLDVFDKLTDIYLQVNSVVNISALKTLDDIYIKHYLDSVYPYKYFGESVCDVGCGGGFPTIPIAIITGLPVTGMDSVGKKLLLIERCRSELDLPELKSKYIRSEDAAKLHDRYDTVCARAVADVDRSLLYCAPLAENCGKILLYRTQNDSAAERKTVEKTNTVLEEKIDYTLPGTDIKRRLFVYSKN